MVDRIGELRCIVVELERDDGEQCEREHR
jgi:hypothetical protein